MLIFLLFLSFGVVVAQQPCCSEQPYILQTAQQILDAIGGGSGPVPGELNELINWAALTYTTLTYNETSPAVNYKLTELIRKQWSTQQSIHQDLIGDRAGITAEDLYNALVNALFQSGNGGAAQPYTTSAADLLWAISTQANFTSPKIQNIETRLAVGGFRGTTYTNAMLLRDGLYTSDGSTTSAADLLLDGNNLLVGIDGILQLMKTSNDYYTSFLADQLGRGLFAVQTWGPGLGNNYSAAAYLNDIDFEISQTNGVHLPNVQAAVDGQTQALVKTMVAANYAADPTTAANRSIASYLSTIDKNIAEISVGENPALLAAVQGNTQAVVNTMTSALYATDEYTSINTSIARFSAETAYATEELRKAAVASVGEPPLLSGNNRYASVLISGIGHAFDEVGVTLDYWGNLPADILSSTSFSINSIRSVLFGTATNGYRTGLSAFRLEAGSIVDLNHLDYPIAKDSFPNVAHVPGAAGNIQDLPLFSDFATPGTGASNYVQYVVNRLYRPAYPGALYSAEFSGSPCLPEEVEQRFGIVLNINIPSGLTSSMETNTYIMTASALAHFNEAAGPGYPANMVLYQELLCGVTVTVLSGTQGQVYGGCGNTTFQTPFGFSTGFVSSDSFYASLCWSPGVFTMRNVFNQLVMADNPVAFSEALIFPNPLGFPNLITPYPWMQTWGNNQNNYQFYANGHVPVAWAPMVAIPHKMPTDIIYLCSTLTTMPLMEGTLYIGGDAVAGPSYLTNKAQYTPLIVEWFEFHETPNTRMTAAMANQYIAAQTVGGSTGLYVAYGWDNGCSGGPTGTYIPQLFHTIQLSIQYTFAP